MRRPLTLALLTIVALLSSCRVNVDLGRRGPDITGRRSELQAAHEVAIRRGAGGDVIGAISEAFAPTGIYGAALRANLGTGPTAARRFLERDTLNAGSHSRWIVVRLDVSADGGDGYSYGYLDFIRANGDTMPGAYKAYWRRGAGGEWKMLAFGRTPRAPGPITALPDSLKSATRTYRHWPMRDTSEAWRTLQGTDDAFSELAATDIRAAFMAYAASDGGRVDGSRYVFGRRAIGDGFLTPPPGFNGMSWHAEYGSVAKSNDLGFNLGPVMRLSAGGAPPVAAGLFLTIWRREVNGEWRWIVD